MMMIPILRTVAVAWLRTRDTRATTTSKRNAKNNVKAGKNAIKVLNNNNSIQIRKKTVKKRFTDRIQGLFKMTNKIQDILKSV